MVVIGKTLVRPLSAAVFALALTVIAIPVYAAEDTAVAPESAGQPAVEEAAPAEPQAKASDESAEDPEVSPSDAAPTLTLTVEQVRDAIEEADRRRLALLQADPTFPKELVEKWGVEVIGINSTMAGLMLDFRFRVLDAEKALPLFDHRIKPYIIAEKSQIKLPVPMAAKVGAFRPTNRGKNIKGDKTYYMIFANPDHHVKKGEQVTIVIGDFRAEGLTVR